MIDFPTSPELQPVLFPGEEVHINQDQAPGDYEVAVVRGGDAASLVTAQLWADWCGDTPRALVIPYLPGARQDHDVPFGARVYANLINAVGADVVLCADPHSMVEVGMVAHAQVADTSFALQQFVSGKNIDVVVIPDEGARARGLAAANLLGVQAVQAYKHRDRLTGKLSGFSCDPIPDGATVCVVDDICDGGGTFLGLATTAGFDPAKTHLYTTHGIYSKGTRALLGAYATLGCTDSHWKAQLYDDVNVIPVTDTLVASAIQLLGENNA